MRFALGRDVLSLEGTVRCMPIGRELMQAVV